MTQKKVWVYTGPDIDCLVSDDLPSGMESDSEFAVSVAQLNRFRENCREMGLMEEITLLGGEDA